MQLRKQRRKARVVTIQLLYCMELTDVDIEDILSDKVIFPDIDFVDDYSKILIRGVVRNKNSIDRLLSSTSKNWSVKRMPIVDKCILRMAIFEMLYLDKVPVSVSINEAVELAKKLGGDDESHKFVNGVLGKISRGLDTK